MNFQQIENSFEPSADGKAAVAPGGMVASAFPDATEAGVHILQHGGNAVDAACAVGFALGVCDPQMSGIGGQTLGVIHIKGRIFALDGWSRVPSLAHLSRMSEQDRAVGYRAATVPSTPATLAWLHQHYGRLPWQEILQPAISIARLGYPITERTRTLQQRELTNFLSVPSRSGAEYFLKDGTQPYDVGDLFRQPDLANLLKVLSHKGVEEFYVGDIATQIDADMRKNGGFLRADDLALIPWPIVRQPLRRRYRAVDVATMPPPGSGRTLLLVLLMLNALDPIFLEGQLKAKYHFVAETFRKAFMLRTQRPFDPNTYPQVADKKMLDRRFAARLAASIAETTDPKLPIDTVATPADEFDETTHFCVMDAQDGVVSITQSVELAYGSKAAAAGLGFLYNNYMMALDTQDVRHPYYLRPNAVPWSSAAPSIVFHDGRPWMALGSPGSELIYSSIAQVLMHTIDGGVSIAEAIQRPRLHCSLGGTISLETEGFPNDVVSYLREAGYQLDLRAALSLGCVQAVLRRHDRSGFQGVADLRRDGSAMGV